MVKPSISKRFAREALVLWTVLIVFQFPVLAQDDELSLYSSSGKAVAYIVESDATIYLWSGEPVAYLKDNDVYGFNGKHLGWFKSGALYDHDGAVVGCSRSRYPGSVEPEPFKAFKQFKPFKAFTEFAPLKPIFTTSWSEDSLKLFLAQGKAN